MSNRLKRDLIFVIAFKVLLLGGLSIVLRYEKQPRTPRDVAMNRIYHTQ